jgi:hypothetical protein
MTTNRDTQRDLTFHGLPPAPADVIDPRQRRQPHPAAAPVDDGEEDPSRVDETLADSFPASDPPAGPGAV